MFVGLVVVSVLCAVLLGYTAVRKLGHRPEVVASYRRAGVPEPWLNRLAVLLLAAAAGLIGGLFWTPLGIAAAVGLVCYFAVAIVFHLRARDTGALGTPIAMAVLAAAALTLHLLT